MSGWRWCATSARRWIRSRRRGRRCWRWNWTRWCRRLWAMARMRTPRQMTIYRMLSDFATFSRACWPDAPLRPYQLEAALPVLAAVERGAGGSFCWLFARQAGKDETLARALAECDVAGTVFRADWQRVAADVPAYGDHVRGRIAALGATHPFIRTEYGLEELDAAGGLFPPARQAQMRGDHARQHAGT